MNFKINLIKPDTDIQSLKMSKMPWDVEVRGVPYQVVDINDFIHSYTSHSANSLWMYPRDEEPCFDNLVQYDCDGNGVLWDFVYSRHNVCYSKYDEDFVYTINCITIRRNEVAFCKAQSVADAIRKIEIINEHPLDLYCIDYDLKCIGRKVFYYGQPFVVKSFVKYEANVVLLPEEGYTFICPPELEGCTEEDDHCHITSIFDPHIYWFRD